MFPTLNFSDTYTVAAVSQIVESYARSFTFTGHLVSSWTDVTYLLS